MLSRPALPAWYVTGRERGASVVALPSVFEAVLRHLRAAPTLYDAAALQPGATAFTGRGAAWRIPLGAETCVVRHFRRGGAVATLLGDRYLRVGVPRPLRELNASASARARGVRTPEVLAVVTYAATPFYRADIATRFIPDSIDLATAALDPQHAGVVDRAAGWRAAGELLRTAFGAGVEHADLNLRNILIAGDGTAVEAHLLDLDRAVVRDGAVSDAARTAMLERLHRSRRKLEMHYGTAASTAELAAFAEGLHVR